MNNNRVTYVPNDILENFPWIKGEDVGKILDYTKIKSKSDFTVLSIIKVLFPVSKGAVNFTKLYHSSGIRMKKSFLNYLNFCLDRELIQKETSFYKGHKNYSITEKGVNFLRLFL